MQCQTEWSPAPSADRVQKIQMASEYRDISSLYQGKKDIYRDIISTIEKRNLSGYDIFLQTLFWILYHIIYPNFLLDINIPNISLNRIYIRDGDQTNQPKTNQPGQTNFDKPTFDKPT